MKKILIVMTTALATAVGAAEPVKTPQPVVGPLAAKELKPGTPRKAKMTRDQRKALAYRTMMQKTGGFVIRPGSQLGKVVFVNGQKRVPQDVIEKQTALLTEILQVRIEVVGGENTFSIKDVQSKKKTLAANAVIFFIDDPELADTMLVAPETGWAVVNFAAMTSDKPDDEHLRKRTIRQVWRSFAHLLGAANSIEPKCVLRPVTCPGDLDDLVAEAFCPEPLDKIAANLKAIGVDAAERKTYRQACIEGWAPAPTNEFQTAICEQVKADKERGPTNPLVIKPPAQKK